MRDTSVQVMWHQASTLDSRRKCGKAGKKQRESVGLYISGLSFKGKQEKWVKNGHNQLFFSFHFEQLVWNQPLRYAFFLECGQSSFIVASSNYTQVRNQSWVPVHTHLHVNLQSFFF